jgi:hypothetical protein
VTSAEDEPVVDWGDVAMLRTPLRELLVAKHTQRSFNQMVADRLSPVARPYHTLLRSCLIVGLPLALL